MWKRALHRGWLLLVSLALIACAHRDPGPPDRYAAEAFYEEEDAGVYGLQLGGEASRPMRARAQVRADAAPPPPPPSLAGEDGGSSSTDSHSALDPAHGDRMVFYNGMARLRVAKVDEAQRHLQALAAAVGGLVEHQYAGAITLRVPVLRFQEVYGQVLEIGEVLDKRISASDLTDRYAATALRLQTAQTTRDRLITLLAQAETEADKLYLIREIQRLTEEIDRLEGRSRALESMAALSRITVELVPRAQVTWQGSGEDAAELGWIRELSPFRMEVARAHRKLQLDTPEGMVALQERGPWVAESADGARVWSASLPNEPLGTTEFWLGALEARIAPEFSVAERGSLGRFLTLRLVSRDDAPYVWVVGVAVVGKRLHVVEQFFPSLAQEARYRDAVAVAIAEGGDA